MQPNHQTSSKGDRFGLLGRVLADKFRIEQFVAEGGFGVVYGARHLTLEIPVALKVLKAPRELNDVAKRAFVDTFLLEAKTIARIKHPNIVQVLDTGVATMPNGEYAPWMALEWIDGYTLQVELNRRRGRPRSPAETFALMRPVLDAFAFAHEEGIAHRDIKPGNVMLSETRRGLSLKVLDFGIAKLVPEGETAGSGETRTTSSLQAYSPQYAAPEQVSRTRTGPWTDVHALGLILTELLTGHPPYRGGDPTDLIREILGDPRPTPAKFAVNVGAWEDVLKKAVAYKSEHRFANAGQLLSALEATLPSVSSSTFVNVTGGHAAIPDNSVTGPMNFPSSSSTGPQTGPNGSSTTGNNGIPLAMQQKSSGGKLGILLGVGAIVIVSAGLGIGAMLGEKAPPASPTVHVAAPSPPPVAVPAAIAPTPPAPVAAPEPPPSAPAQAAQPEPAADPEPATTATAASTDNSDAGRATRTRSTTTRTQTRTRNNNSRVPEMW